MGEYLFRNRSQFTNHDATVTPSCDIMSNESNTNYGYWWKWDVAGVTFITLITLTSIIGNSALCWLITCDPSLRTIPNRLILNLACCDLMTSLLNVPMILVTLVHQKWIGGAILCEVCGYFTTFLSIASVVTLAVISVNRLFMIVYTAKCSVVFTPRRTNFMIAGVWLFAALCAAPPLLGWSDYTFIPAKAMCTLSLSRNISYTLTMLTLGVVVPFTIMLFSYFRIAIAVRNSKRRIRPMVNRRLPDTGIKQQLFQTVVTLVATAVGVHGNEDPKRANEGKKKSLSRLSADAVVTPTPDGSPNVGRRLLSDYSDSEAKGIGLGLPTRAKVSVHVEDVSSSVEDLDLNRPRGDRPSFGRSSGIPSITLPGEMPTASEPTSTQTPSLTIPVESKWLSGSPERGRPTTAPKQRKLHRRRSSLEAPMSPVWHIMDDAEALGLPLPFPRRRLSLDDGATSSGVNLAHAQFLSAANLSAPASRCASQESLNSQHGNHCSSGHHAASDITKASSLTNLLSDSEAKNVIDANREKRGRRSDELRVTSTIFLVILVFVLSWAPISVVNCVETLTDYKTPLLLNRFAVCMVFLQTALNPVLYGARNRNFREGFKGLFCCICQKYKHSSTKTSKI